MINLGVVGIGKMGQFFINTISKQKDVIVTNISSKSKKTLNKFPDTYIKTTNYKTLIKSNLDGVIIATPATTHFEIASFFIKIGVPVLIEKPLTTNYTDAQTLLKLQKNKKIPVLVDHTLLFHPAYRKMKGRIREVGTIKSINFVGHNNNIRKDTSIVYDWGPHGISLILDLLKEEPRRIYVKNFEHKGKIITSLQIGMDFDNNINCFLDLSWVSKEKKRQLKIIGAEGSLTFDDMKNKKLIFINNKDLKPLYLKYDSIQPLDNLVGQFIKIIRRRDMSSKNLLFSSNIIKWAERIDNLVYREIKS